MEVLNWLNLHGVFKGCDGWANIPNMMFSFITLPLHNHPIQYPIIRLGLHCKGQQYGVLDVWVVSFELKGAKLHINVFVPECIWLKSPLKVKVFKLLYWNILNIIYEDINVMCHHMSSAPRHFKVNPSNHDWAPCSYPLLPMSSYCLLKESRN